MSLKIGILIFNQAQPLDVIGPWEVFAAWKNVLLEPIELSLVAEEKTLIHCCNNIDLMAHVDFAHCPPLDYLIVAGGRGRAQQIHNQHLLSFIQSQAKSCKKILSVCTGAFLLYYAGLLNGKKATTYWRALPELYKLENIEIVEERIVKNHDIWLSGGITSGIDLALELIKEIAGNETAGKIQLLLEYFPVDTIYTTPDTVKTLPDYNHRSSREVAGYIKTKLAE